MGPNVGTQTSSCASTNERARPVVRLPVETTYTLRCLIPYLQPNEHASADAAGGTDHVAERSVSHQFDIEAQSYQRAWSGMSGHNWLLKASPLLRFASSFPSGPSPARVPLL